MRLTHGYQQAAPAQRNNVLGDRMACIGARECIGDVGGGSYEANSNENYVGLPHVFFSSAHMIG